MITRPIYGKEEYGFESLHPKFKKRTVNKKNQARQAATRRRDAAKAHRTIAASGHLDTNFRPCWDKFYAHVLDGFADIGFSILIEHMLKRIPTLFHEGLMEKVEGKAKPHRIKLALHVNNLLEYHLKHNPQKKKLINSNLQLEHSDSVSDAGDDSDTISTNGNNDDSMLDDNNNNVINDDACAVSDGVDDSVIINTNGNNDDSMLDEVLHGDEANVNNDGMEGISRGNIDGLDETSDNNSTGGVPKGMGRRHVALARRVDENGKGGKNNTSNLSKGMMSSSMNKINKVPNKEWRAWAKSSLHAICETLQDLEESVVSMEEDLKTVTACNLGNSFSGGVGALAEVWGVLATDFLTWIGGDGAEGQKLVLEDIKRICLQRRVDCSGSLQLLGSGQQWLDKYLRIANNGNIIIAKYYARLAAAYDILYMLNKVQKSNRATDSNLLPDRILDETLSDVSRPITTKCFKPLVAQLKIMSDVTRKTLIAYLRHFVREQRIEGADGVDAIVDAFLAAATKPATMEGLRIRYSNSKNAAEYKYMSLRKYKLFYESIHTPRLQGQKEAMRMALDASLSSCDTSKVISLNENNNATRMGMGKVGKMGSSKMGMGKMGSSMVANSNNSGKNDKHGKGKISDEERSKLIRFSKQIVDLSLLIPTAVPRGKQAALQIIEEADANIAVSDLTTVYACYLKRIFRNLCDDINIGQKVNSSKGEFVRILPVVLGKVYKEGIIFNNFNYGGEVSILSILA